MSSKIQPIYTRQPFQESFSQGRTPHHPQVLPHIVGRSHHSKHCHHLSSLKFAVKQPAGLTYLENADKLLAVTCSAEKNRISKLHLLVLQIHLTTNVWPSRVPGGWIRLDKPRLAASHNSSMNGSWAMVQSLATLSPIIFTSSNCRVLNEYWSSKCQTVLIVVVDGKKGTSSYLRLRCRLGKTLQNTHRTYRHIHSQSQ